jgi:acyl transferase domain-containing protein
MNGTVWQSLTFFKILKLADMPWLRDHRLGAQVIFPGAGYCDMAVEAVYQTAMMTQWGEKEPARYRYRLRDIKFSRALVLEEDVETRYSLALAPQRGGSTRKWFEFRVCSLQNEIYTEHCSGFVCVETSYKDDPIPDGAMEPLTLATPTSVIYIAATDSGDNYGPCFQQHKMHEATMGKFESR